MGKPLKILEIIKKIHQKFNKDNELNIKVIGKNKAEKLKEKLTVSTLKSTTLKNINFVKEKIVDIKDIEKFLDKIGFYLNKLDEKKILYILKKFISKKNK